MSAAPSVNNKLRMKLEVIKGPHAGDIFETDKDSFTIGRGPENDFVLTNDPRISRQHVEIKQEGDELVLTNLSQKNFVMLNGVAIQTEKILKASILSVGESEIKVTTDKFEENKPKVSIVSAEAYQAAQAVVKKPVLSQPTRLKPVARPQFLSTAGGPGLSAAGAAIGDGVATSPPQKSAFSNTKVRNYSIMAGVVIILLVVLMNTPQEKKSVAPKGALPFRSVEQMEAVKVESEQVIEGFKEKNSKLNTIEFKRAQENFIKGYRDYRQGQFARAKEAFQVVLNLDPENQLAKKYLDLAKLRFSEQINFHMSQGLKYREKKNFRLCKASYANALTMLQHQQQDPRFVESKTLFEECSVALEGRF